MKIVSLLTKKQTRQLFHEEALRELLSLGDVTVRASDDLVSPQEAEGLLADADVAITSWGCPQLTEALVKNAPGLGLIVHAGGTVKPIVARELWAKGIRVCCNNDALGLGVAETALALTITSLKNIWTVARDVADGGWDEHYADIREMFDVTVGVIGAGCAGRHYMRLLQAFDVRVLLYDPFVDAAGARALGAEKAELNELLAASDVVSIHAPSIPETRHMICEKTLALMKRDGILINTARGSLVDEDALYQAMRKGWLKFACLDVTDPEPPRPDHPLRSLPNVILTPHLAGLANNGLGRIGQNVVGQIRAYQAKQPIPGEVLAASLDHIA